MKNDPAQSATPTAADSRLTPGEKVGYGLGDTASNLYWKFFENFLPYFYTDVFGIKTQAVGVMLLLTRIWDAINDPFIGYLADRTNTRWGRFRPWLLWMAVPFAITGILTLFTPDLGYNGKLIYAYITYTLVMMVYTAINIPYGALMGVITPNSLERTSVSTYRFVAAFCGGIIVQYCTLQMVGWFGGTETIVENGTSTERVINPQAGFFWTMVVFAVAAAILFIITFSTTRERVEPEIDRDSTFGPDLKFILTSRKLHQILLLGLAALFALATGFATDYLPWILAGYLALTGVSLLVSYWAKMRFADVTEPSTLAMDFGDLITNRPWLVLFGFGLFQLTSAFVRGGAIVYYFKYYVGDASYATMFLVYGSFAAIAGMLLTRQLTSIFGKKMLMIYMNAGTALCMLPFLVLNPEQMTGMYAFHIIGSFISGPSPVLLWAMYADVADYSEWKTSRRATGLIFSAATFSQKMGCAVGSAMTGFALNYYAYTPPVEGVDQTQSQTALDGLTMMMSVIPASFLVVAAACMLFYNLDEGLMQNIETDLAKRKTENVTPDA
ncbi:MAG: MFS transporter [Pirellulaceae bacterium]